MQPKVTVVIPIYDTEKYLADCLNSVINQTLENIEIICVEDGSTDNSKKILAEYEKADSRIRVIWHTNNMGVGLARKHGVLAARGQYIMCLDSDDELFPHACETAYTAIEKYKTDVLEFGVKAVDTAGKEKIIDWLETEPMERTEADNLVYLWLQGKLKNWMVWKKIYRSDLCKQVFREMEDLHISMAEDAYLFCVLGYYARSVSVISEQLYLYRWGVGVSTTLHTIQFVSLEIFKKMLEEKDSLDAITRFINNKPDKEGYKSFIQILHDDWLHLAVTLWQGKLTEEDQDEGFLLLIRKWGLEETAKGLRWLINTQQNNAQKEKGRLETELEQTKNNLAISITQQNEVQKEKERLESELDQTKNDLAFSITQQNEAQKEKERMETELDRTKNDLEVVKQRALEAELKIKAVETGLSFRLGRAVTYIPRKLLGRP